MCLLSVSRWLQAPTWRGLSPWPMWSSFPTLLLPFASGERLCAVKSSPATRLSAHAPWSHTRCFPSVRLSAGRYPRMAKYYSLLKDRASIKASRPPHWLAGPQGYDALKDLWTGCSSPFRIVSSILTGKRFSKLWVYFIFFIRSIKTQWLICSSSCCFLSTFGSQGKARSFFVFVFVFSLSHSWLSQWEFTRSVKSRKLKKDWKCSIFIDMQLFCFVFFSIHLFVCLVIRIFVWFGTAQYHNQASRWQPRAFIRLDTSS